MRVRRGVRTGLRVGIHAGVRHNKAVGWRLVRQEELGPAALFYSTASFRACSLAGRGSADWVDCEWGNLFSDSKRSTIPDRMPRNTNRYLFGKSMFLMR